MQNEIERLKRENEYLLNKIANTKKKILLKQKYKKILEEKLKILNS